LSQKVLVDEDLEVDRGLYLAMVMDVDNSRIAVIALEEVGIEIEVVSAES